MKGDFTRDTFDPVMQFSRVLMQQGRVQLDADWNEQISILLHYLRTLAADIVGPHAGPDGDDLGFALIRDSAEWEDIAPDDDDERKIHVKDELENNNVLIGAGRYYVDGILVENPRAILYDEQHGYPFTDEMTRETLHDHLDNVVVYLDVWERHITFNQIPNIREVALGEADTCTRAQLVWQVKFLFNENEDDLDCENLMSLLERTRPKLRADAKRRLPSPDLCSASPDSRYFGPENQLYRVEVHEVEDETSTADNDLEATFKWSRNNGSIVFPITTLTGNTVVVANFGSDRCSALRPGDWVEVCDDLLALREQSGPLARVETVDREGREITVEWPSGLTQIPSYDEGDWRTKHPLLRRWDHVGDLGKYHGALPITESEDTDENWIDLEYGVRIWFAKGGEYRVGDYWLIPARVATGDVEWPEEIDDENHSKPAEQEPHGPKHYYAPLFHASDGEDGQKVEDCRCTIKPIRECESDPGE